MKIPILLMASGAGSTFAAIADAAIKQELDCEVIGLVVSRADCGAIEEAKKRHIPVRIFDPKEFSQHEDFDFALSQYLVKINPRWIVLAGYTQKLGIHSIQSFRKQIINIHPSLLPRYGGKGMYGKKVHEAVLLAKEKLTGISIHLVSEEYDRGPILAQTEVEVLDTDTVETLMARLQKIEKHFFIATLKRIFTNAISI